MCRGVNIRLVWQHKNLVIRRSTCLTAVSVDCVYTQTHTHTHTTYIHIHTYLHTYICVQSTPDIAPSSLSCRESLRPEIPPNIVQSRPDLRQQLRSGRSGASRILRQSALSINTVHCVWIYIAVHLKSKLSTKRSLISRSTTVPCACIIGQQHCSTQKNVLTVYKQILINTKLKTGNIWLGELH